MFSAADRLQWLIECFTIAIKEEADGQTHYWRMEPPKKFQPLLDYEVDSMAFGHMRQNSWIFA